MPSSPSLSPTRRLDRRDFLRVLGAAGGATAATGVLAACGGGSSAPAGGGGAVGAGKTIGLSLNGLNAYSTYVAEGVLKVLDGTGYAFRAVQNNFDSSTELSNIQSLLSQGVAGLVVLPANANTLGTAAQLASGQNIPVGNALWPGPGNSDQYFTGVAAIDSVAGGQMIGDWLKQNGKPGKVIVVQGILGQNFSERIDQGLDKSLAGSGFDIVVRNEGFFDRQKAVAVVESGLQAHPDATAIVAYSASMSDGIASYLKSRGLSGLTHVSSDADDELFSYLDSPYLAATRYYSAAQTGEVVTTAVRAKIEGGSPVFQSTISQMMVTAANSKAEIAKVPYSYPQFSAQVAKI